MKILSQDDFEKVNVFGKGSLNEAFSQYFIGNSFLNFQGYIFPSFHRDF